MEIVSTIGVIGVPLLIIGIVEALKEFGVAGKWLRVAALALGVFFTGLAIAVSESFIPVDIQPYVLGAVSSLAGGLDAMGYYSLFKRVTMKDRILESLDDKLDKAEELYPDLKAILRNVG